METITYEEYLKYLLEISTSKQEQELIKKQLKEIEEKEKNK